MALTRDAGHVVELVRVEQRPPDQVALMLLSSTAVALLTSGRYHIYRGILSGKGHALVSVFSRCISELQQRGYQTDEETQEALRRLGDEIKKLG